MRIQRLGPEGIQSRIRELQARLDSRLGTTTQTVGAPGAMPGALSGSIGGTAPMNPFESGVRVISDPAAPPELRPLLDKAADQAGVDRKLLEALVGVESEFNPKALSAKGARGLTQLMPTTAADLGVTDPYDPEQNLKAGANYLSQLLRSYNGDTRLALAAYNAGPGAVTRAGGIPPFRETQSYIEKVMARADALRQR